MCHRCERRNAKVPAFTICGIALFLHACAPVVSSRYEPHGTGKVLGPGACSSDDYARMEFSLDGGVLLFVDAKLPGKGDALGTVGASLVLQPLQQARLEDTTLKVKAASMTDYVSVPISELTVVYSGSSPDGSKPSITKMEANQTMSGGPVGIGTIIRKTTFGFEVPLPFQGLAEFTVKIPTIILGTGSVTIDPVTFKVITHPRLVGFAC